MGDTIEEIKKIKDKTKVLRILIITYCIITAHDAHKALSVVDMLSIIVNGVCCIIGINLILGCNKLIKDCNNALSKIKSIEDQLWTNKN